MSRRPPAPLRVVLIGAARSGTKVVRDALSHAAGAGAVPYDIGFVWRAGHQQHPDDVLDPAWLTPRAKKFVAGFVDGYAAGQPPAVIEKTVGNTLRVPYVAEVLPDAVFVHLIRDGVDVAESTLRQWREPADYRYLARKIRHFPLRLAPTYGRRYVQSLVRRRAADDRRVATWGARYPGIEDDLVAAELLTVCARQWRESVSRARQDLGASEVPTIEVRYERLIANPREELARMSEFCGLGTSLESLAGAAAKIEPGRGGQGRRALPAADLALLDVEIGDLLTELGYDRPTGANENPPTRRT